MITIDTREPQDKFRDAAEQEGLVEDEDYEFEYLQSGDFLAADYICERKKYGDFIGRLTQSERDIWQQILALDAAASELDYTPVLILEGEWAEALRWSNLTAKEVISAIGSIVKLDIRVVHTTGIRATVQLLMKLGDGTTHDIGSIRDTPSVPDDLLPRYITESFVGVGPSRAEDILDEYGNFANVVQQLVDDPDELKEIDGIGDATVEKMVNMVTQEW